MWDYGGPLCYRDLVRGDHQEGPGLAGRGQYPGPGGRPCRFSGFLSSHLVGELVRGGRRASSSERNKKRASSLVSRGKSWGKGGILPTLAGPQYAVRAAFTPVEATAVSQHAKAHPCNN